MEFIIEFFIVTGIGFAISAFIAVLYAFINEAKLSLYLKNNKYEEWRKDLLHGWDSFSASHYINSDLDNEDENILRLKDKAKIGTRYMGIFFIAFLVNMGIVIALIIIGRG